MTAGSWFATPNDPAMQDLDVPRLTISWCPPPAPPLPWEDEIDGDDVRESVMT